MGLDGDAGKRDGLDGSEGGEPEQGLGGRFRIEDGEIVPEGRGEVLFSYDEELGRPVVLKRTHSAEARALAKIVHRHIITVYDVLTVDDGPRAGTWLVMERAPHGSLSGRTFSHREAAGIGAQIADALTALHRKGLVHCDVKPANIVMDAEGTAKLTDFDAARRLGGTETISPDSPISYTPDYAAPEVVGGNPGTASDVFSLGATIYALIAGNSPRPWAHGDETADEADEHDPDGNRRIVGWEVHHGVIEMAADIGPLRPVLTAMLHAEPGKRPTAAEAHAALRDIVDPPGLWRKARDTARRRWKVVTAVAATLALAASGTAWLADRDDRPATLTASTAPTSVASPAASGSPDGRGATEAKIVASKGPSTTFGRSCRKNCAFVEFRATGLKPGKKYVFKPYTSNWGEFNSGASFTPDENGEQHTDNRFPCNAVGQQVWIVAEGPDGERIVSNKFTWTAG
ncbi:serine/threonine-protein kinase [Nonomuraea purpurea]|uniref:non-specific serine/threonine protein kinase n=1 Tax=Nonomuraea purpurea TaxID=1849276 RepID=A0ABV8G384_9ACTN